MGMYFFTEKEQNKKVQRMSQEPGGRVEIRKSFFRM